MKINQMYVKEEYSISQSLYSSTQQQITSKSDPKYIVRVKTFLTESAVSTGRVQPSDSPQCAHYSNEKKKTSRKRKAEAAPTVLEYNLHYMPRILKNDLRRQYPVMFKNVFNSCDSNYMRIFLETFCRPDMVNVLESFEPHLHMRKEEHGYDSCGKEFAERMSDSPDSLFTLQEIQMRVKSNGTCALHSKFELSGTKMIYINPQRIVNIIRNLMKGNLMNEKSKDTVEQGEETNEVLTLPFTPEPPAHLIASSTISSPHHTSDSSSDFGSVRPTFKSVHTHESLSSTDDPPDEYLLSDNDLFPPFEDCYVQSEEASLLSLFDNIRSNHNQITETIKQSDTIVKTEELMSIKAEGKDSSSSSSSIDRDESDYDYLYQKFEDAMNLHRDCNAPRKSEETLALTIPYRFVGDFIQHIDLESKVFLTHFAVRVAR